MKRKTASIVLAILMILTMFPMIGSAAPKNGDPMGDVLYSDIVAYINGCAIPTSIKNGTTMVVVEDLANYGFDVKWDKSARTLKVERNFDKAFNPISVEKDTTHKPGTFKCKYVYTDIKTYLSGKEVESFAINGVTLIDFELLADYGKVNWNGAAREIKIALAEDSGKIYVVADYYKNDGTYSELGRSLPFDPSDGERVLAVKKGDILVVGERKYKVAAESLRLIFHTKSSMGEVILWWTDRMNNEQKNGNIIEVK